MVIVVVVVVVVVSRTSPHASDAADNATGRSTDHAANRCANRTGGAPTFGRTSLTAPDNALSLSGERHRKNDNKANKTRGQPVFHG